MSQKTYSDIKTFVQNKLDLNDEDFISDDEMLEYTEEALKFVEAEIHKLGIEDLYFETQSALPLVSGRSDYALPDNIYANKILRAVYSLGGDIYAVHRMRKLNRYEDSESIRYAADTTGNYQYRIVNIDPRVGTKIRLFPTPDEDSSDVSTTGDIAADSASITVASTAGITAGDFVFAEGIARGTRVESVESSTTLTLTDAAYTTAATVDMRFIEPRLLIYYIRDVFIPDDATDYIDVPEFWPVVAQHIIVNCLKKELGNPRLPAEQANLEAMRAQMIETLTNMVPDGDDEIEGDMGHYIEQGAMV